MNITALQKRLDRIDPPQGKYDHLSDEELEQALMILTRSLLETAGDGDAAIGYDRFRQSSEIELPATVEQFITGNRSTIDRSQREAFHEFINSIEGQEQ